MLGGDLRCAPVKICWLPLFCRPVTRKIHGIVEATRIGKTNPSCGYEYFPLARRNGLLLRLCSSCSFMRAFGEERTVDLSVDMFNASDVDSILPCSFICQVPYHLFWLSLLWKRRNACLKNNDISNGNDGIPSDRSESAICA